MLCRTSWAMSAEANGLSISSDGRMRRPPKTASEITHSADNANPPTKILFFTSSPNPSPLVASYPPSPSRSLRDPNLTPSNLPKLLAASALAIT
jgi:hypothetical protein